MLLQYMKESEGKSDQKYLKSFIRVMQHMGPDQNQGVGIEALSTSAGAKVKQIWSSGLVYLLYYKAAFYPRQKRRPEKA